VLRAAEGVAQKRQLQNGGGFPDRYKAFQDIINSTVCEFTLVINHISTTNLGKKRSSCCTRPKKTKTNQKNPKKHPENPPKMHASQGRHTSNDGSLYSRASTRPTPSNSPL